MTDSNQENEESKEKNPADGNLEFAAKNNKLDSTDKNLNLDKDVEIWIDSSTATPLLMVTTVPFGFLRPKIKLVLIS